jgi:hypothetical protein
MGRSQRHFRHREGYDHFGGVPYEFNEPSLKTEAQQRAAVLVYSGVATPPAANTVAPALTGTLKVGSTLTTTNGTWTGDSPTYGREWLRNGTVIAGETATTYVLAAADLGATIQTRVTATDSGGTSQELSNLHGPVAQMDAPVNTVLPAITGTAQVGETLTTTNGTWTGSGTITYARAWKRDDVAIGGATALTYVLVEADEGALITCTVTATNAGGSTEATSAATAEVIPA